MYVPKESTAEKEINRILQCTAWTMRTTPNMVTKYSPGNIVFNRDMIFHKTVVANWELIQSRRRAQQTKTTFGRTEAEQAISTKLVIVFELLQQSEKDGVNFLDMSTKVHMTSWQFIIMELSISNVGILRSASTLED